MIEGERYSGRRVFAFLYSPCVPRPNDLNGYSFLRTSPSIDINVILYCETGGKLLFYKEMIAKHG